MSADIDLAYAHCQRVAKQSAKNFYYAFRTLPVRKRNAIYATYAFCRVCDDIADDDLALHEKKRQLAHVRNQLAELEDGAGGDPVFTALSDATRTFGIPARYFEDVIDGVETDLTHNRFQTFDELRDYCYGVASAVGLICIEVFGYGDPKARDYAIDMGLAMQLTNIMRDVKEDAERDRIYIPQQEMQSFGYTEHALMGGVNNDAFRSLMRFQASRARRYFDSASHLLPLLPRESRACPALLHGVYRRILDRIESSGFDVFERRIGLSRRRKVLLTARIWAASLIPAAFPRKR